MPDRIEPDRGKTHEIASIFARNINGMPGVNSADTLCGRTVTGRTGWSAYQEVITCGNCNRSAARLNRED